jgi:tRNA uridine 5-carboxymethylaminomethyl modification enzyme
MIETISVTIKVFGMKYDVIVVGAGHAGCEAALASARMGKKVLMVTILAERIGAVSCNPAVGGLGKGHLVKEVDALGGEMGIATDKNGLQFRILNEAKGPAVRGSRAQIDMDRYSEYMRNVLLSTPNLDVAQEIVEEIVVENGKAQGVKTHLGNIYAASCVIVTSGTFLSGTIHIGEHQQNAGRAGEFAANALSSSLRSLGLELGRLKTGTCPRIDGRSIDFSVMDAQGGDENPIPFSFRTQKEGFAPEQMACFVTYTNTQTHDQIRNNFDRAPLFTGQIQGVGPRYCPSIEDKINRFGDKDSHHLFIEPQTREATEFYINGMSTSLPVDVQIAMVRSVKGLENAKIVRFGYAIEYDFVPPTQLWHTLETKVVEGLYCAGQVNGTTGYEEAAAQGLMAGINGVLKLDGKEPFILSRDEAYIGVMIDDLVTKGVDEPYRMFTSRAEYRLLLREDNADMRLMSYGHELGLIDEITYAKMVKKREQSLSGLALLEESYLTASKENLAFLEELGEDKISDKVSYKNLAGRHSFTVEKLEKLVPQFSEFLPESKEQILIGAKYSHYIDKQASQIRKMRDMEKVKIPEDFVYEGIPGLSTELTQKLTKVKPRTLFNASEISGITPAALDLLHMTLTLKGRQ